MEVKTTVHMFDGEKSGPELYIQAGQHGHELNGIETLRCLSLELNSLDFNGKLTFVPVANPISFDLQTSILPRELDKNIQNLNRTWPGKSSGSFMEQTSSNLWSVASDADALIDIHSGQPQMLTHVSCSPSCDESRELAEAFGTPLILLEDYHNDGWNEAELRSLLHITASELGIPSILVELGNNMELNRKSINFGMTGIMNVMRHMEMVDTPIEPNGKGRIRRNRVGRVIANASGVFVPGNNIQLGHTIKAGDEVGLLYDPQTFEELESISAKESGIVYWINGAGVVNVGERVLDVGVNI
jgi:predicted deacylase